MRGFNEVLEEARGSYKDCDESIRDSYAAGYLAQSVRQLEQELEDVKVNLATERQRRIDAEGTVA